MTHDMFSSGTDMEEMNLRPSLFPVIAECAIAYGPDAYWAHAFMKYKQGGVMKDTLLMALAATTNTQTISKLLNYSLDGSNVIGKCHFIPYLSNQTNAISSFSLIQFLKWSKVDFCVSSASSGHCILSIVSIHMYK